MGWRTKVRQLACPECQALFPAGEVLFLCPERTCPARNSPPPNLPGLCAGRPVFRAPTYDYAVQCAFSPHRAYLKLCPRCGATLPLTTGPAATVAVVGASVSGKTCYMTTLIRQIRHLLSRDTQYEMSLEWDDEKGKQYFRDQEKTIFTDHCLPEPTQKETPLKSLQVTIRFPVRRWRARWRHGRHGVVSLIFPDPSGEMFQDQENVYFLNYLGNARAYVLMVDPFGSNEYRRRLAGPDLPDDPVVSASDTLGSLVTALRRELCRPYGPLDRVLAVTLTKCDEKDMLDPDAEPYRSRFPVQGRWYDPRRARELGAQVERHLRDELGMSDLVSLARQSFARVEFFAVSALGSPPVRSRRNGQLTLSLKNPQPRRVEEPLLWILHQQGYL
jgi:hypothetical protein